MNKLKKLVALLIITTMTLSMVPVNAEETICVCKITDTESYITDTYGYFEYYITDNYAIITKYTGTESKVVIPSEINGYAVTVIGPKAFDFYLKLKEVIIPDTVKALGRSAFGRCMNLTNITIPNSVTCIAPNAFLSCASIKTLTIPRDIAVC